MRIGFNVSPLKSGHAGRGTGVYTQSLLTALKTFAPQHTIVEFSHGEQIPDDVDILHYPFFDPFLLTLPLFKPKPTIITVHDLIPIEYADHFPRGVRGELKWQVQRLSLQGAKHIITDSESSKKSIADHISFQSKRIDVIYLAPDKKFTPQSQSEQQRVRKQYQLPQRFLLYIGDINWNKNIPGLLSAMRDLDLPLVLVGKAFLQKALPEAIEIDQLINKYALNDKILRIGYVPDLDLPALYSAASVYVQASFAEGFGLPVLEAMSCGTPCVVAKTTSLVEIAGPSILVNPHDPKDIASGITRSLKKDAGKEGITWAKQFTWEKTAQKTIEVYEKQ